MNVPWSKYLKTQWSHIQPLIWQQIELIAIVIVLSSVIGVTIGVLVWNRKSISGAVINIAAAILTIPSLALMTLLLPVFGLGWTGTIVALVLYSQLPIVRNTVTGLRSVDAGILESAKGIGMTPARTMLRVHLPMAMPVIVAGVRVATMMSFGISAIAAYVSGPGLGNLIFTGLARFGAVNSLNQALTGGVGMALLALIFDAAFVLLLRLTTARGSRA